MLELLLTGDKESVHGILHQVPVTLVYRSVRKAILHQTVVTTAYSPVRRAVLHQTVVTMAYKKEK